MKLYIEGSRSKKNWFPTLGGGLLGLLLVVVMISTAQPIVGMEPEPVEATFAAPVGLAAPADPADAAGSVTFTILNTCAPNFGGANFSFSVAGTEAASIGGGNDCTCSPPLRTVTTTDPSVLALFGDLCVDTTTLAASVAGRSYVAWVRADVSSPKNSQSVCLMDHAVGNCDEPDLCAAGFAQFTNVSLGSGTTAPIDSDGDGVANCTDPDLDGDGVLNGADNCPATPNAGQNDADSNGIGDMCEVALAAVPWAG